MNKLKTLPHFDLPSRNLSGYLKHTMEAAEGSEGRRRHVASRPLRVRLQIKSPKLEKKFSCSYSP